MVKTTNGKNNSLTIGIDVSGSYSGQEFEPNVKRVPPLMVESLPSLFGLYIVE